jgi:GGDEF domain-containing protein
VDSQFQPTIVQDPGAATGASARAVCHDRTFHALKRSEPWLAWSLAAYAAWLAAAAFPGMVALWAFVLLAGLVGAWACWQLPQLHVQMATRALTLVAGSYVLHTHAGIDNGGSTALLFWLSVTSVYYALMLKPAWAAGVALVAAAGFCLSWLLGGRGAVFELAVLTIFLLILPTLLAMKFGALLHRRDEALQDGRIDGSTALYTRRGLAMHGNELLAACRRRHQPLSLVVFDCSDLLEVRAIYGSEISRKLIAHIVKKLTALAGKRGLAARTGAAQFSVALPLGRDLTLQAIERVLGNPTRIEMDSDSEIVVVPDFLVKTATDELNSVQSLYHSLCRDLGRIQDDERRRQDYLQRERERHSRPMPLMAVPLAPIFDKPAKSWRVASIPVPPTIPMPLMR